jgi:hypothetical protein
MSAWMASTPPDAAAWPAATAKQDAAVSISIAMRARRCPTILLSLIGWLPGAVSRLALFAVPVFCNTAAKRSGCCAAWWRLECTAAVRLNKGCAAVALVILESDRWHVPETSH